MKGIFVTGTDTGVGKTLVSRAILASLSGLGRRIAVMKPCETGVPDPAILGDDALALLSASGLPLDPRDVQLYRYRMAAAPEVAARVVGETLDIDRIVSSAQKLAASADAILVEGAGGLLVPLAATVDMADLARILDLSVVIVARAALGTINHTRLTIEAARARNLRIAGVIFSRATERPGPEEPHNAAAIASRSTGAPLLGTLPFVPPEKRDDLAELARLADEHLDLDALGL